MKEPTWLPLCNNPTETRVSSISPSTFLPSVLFYSSKFLISWLYPVPYFLYSLSASYRVSSSTPISIVLPSHLLSTPLVSLLAESHRDHMPAGVRRLSQWSMTHKDIHKPPSPPHPSYFHLSVILSNLYHLFLIIIVEKSKIGFNYQDQMCCFPKIPCSTR